MITNVDVPSCGIFLIFKVTFYLMGRLIIKISDFCKSLRRVKEKFGKHWFTSSEIILILFEQPALSIIYTHILKTNILEIRFF